MGKRVNNADTWDVVVIGSGLGGLSAAAYLATNGRRTLVLEHHYLAGGNSQVFRRKALGGERSFEFDVGVHYLGDCGPGGVIPTILRGVGLEDAVEFIEMDPDGFDTLLFPDLTFRVPKGWDRYRERLVAAFPDEETGLHRFLDILTGAASDSAGWMLRPLAELFDECGLGPRARAVLGAQSGTYGTPPSRTAVALHAGLLGHYLSGAYYPKGGGQVLPAHLVDVIRSNGGEVRTRARVDRILIEDGATTGVRLTSGEEIQAPVVVSNADLKRTFVDMVGAANVSPQTLERVTSYRMALPIFCVYLALDIDLREQLPRTNFHCFTTFDIEGIYQDAYRGRVPAELSLFVTIASVKDPFTERIAPRGFSSLEIMMIVPPDYSLWSIQQGPTAGERYHRNPEYRALRDRVVEVMVEGAERAIPGLRDHVIWQEAATPVTQERYTLSTGGTSYGIELALDQLGPARAAVTTEIEGLYLAGASTVFGHGVGGAMRGGVGCAGAVLGRDLFAEIEGGQVFGDPSKLTGGGPDWDPWEACR